MELHDKPDVYQIRDRSDLAELSGYLCRDVRPRPAAVTSVPYGELKPPFDVRGLCERYEIDFFVLDDPSLVKGWSRRFPDYHLTRGVTRFFPATGNLDDGELFSWYEPLKKPSSTLPYAERVAEAARKNSDVVRHEVRPPSRAGADEVVVAASPTVPRAGATVSSDAPAEFSRHRINVVDTPEALGRMMALLERDDRELALVVVTRRYGFDRAFVDTEELAKGLDGVAWVFEIVDKRLEFRMSAELAEIGADDCEVYNGAIRTYPAAREREHGLSEDRLLYKAFPNSDVRALTEEVESDVLGLRASSWVDEPVPDAWKEVTAEVTGVLDAAERAVLQYAGGLCIARAEEVLVSQETRGLPISRILRKGMSLHGRLDPSTHMLVGYSDELRVSPREAVGAYREGQTVLVRLVKVAYASCVVALFPGVTAKVEANDICEPGTMPTDVLEVGQVVPALVVSHEGDEWLLSLIQADPDDLQPAPSILEGGPAWLVSDDVTRLPVAPDVAGPPVLGEGDNAEGGPGDVGADELDIPDDAGVDAAMYIEVLYRRLRKAERDNESLRQKVEKERHRAESASRSLLSQRQRGGSVLDRRYRRPAPESFLDDADRVRYEERHMEWLVMEEWTAMFGPGERRESPLPETWSYGDGFFETLADVDVQLRKVVRCLIDVLLRRTSKRQEHVLRANEGAGAPARLYRDDMPILRCYVEQGHHQAARLHYVYGHDGTVTFLSVRKHDDMRT